MSSNVTVSTVIEDITKDIFDIYYYNIPDTNSNKLGLGLVCKYFTNLVYLRKKSLGMLRYSYMTNKILERWRCNVCWRTDYCECGNISMSIDEKRKVEDSLTTLRVETFGMKFSEFDI